MPQPQIPPLRTITATRYVTPLREGGSLPAIVEADDDGMYVLKFRGAGQGPKALIAELVAGEVGRAAGLPVPEIVAVTLDADLARTEPDPEIQHLIRTSAGLNLALDYLPGAVTFDPVVEHPDADLASSIVWFDAFVTNVDRTARNTNMLMWHRRLWLIDHGAALYFHHDWDNYLERSRDPFPLIRDHVLLRAAGSLEAAAARMRAALTASVIHAIVARIPGEWLGGESAWSDPARHRAAYAEYLLRRLESADLFLAEALRARSLHL
ncbi:MAG: HipA family kinase [Gemmatimonadota bacterium]